MNRNRLKAYAPKARKDFIRAVTDRAAKFGITAKRIEPVHEDGDAVIISGQAYPRKVAEQRKKLLRAIHIRGFDQVMEEIAYTWFNRFAAIRFMEVNGYLDHGYRVLSHPEGRAIPEILEKAESVDFPGLNRQNVIEMKLDGRSDADLYRMLLVAQCNALHRAMPFLFERIDDETELLLPDNLLHSDSVIRRMIDQIDEQDWQEIEIVGWLYQFYISEKKDQVIGKVVKSEDIPAATQLFTPNWIVKYMVQNSLGHKWLATYPNSPLKAKLEYYIEPAEQTAEVRAKLAEITPKELDPEQITFMDPSCGSGHILIEAYNLYREIYLERGYQLRDIPRLILEKSLYGLEICDRAAQLAGFAVLMRARRDNSRILQDPPTLNIVAIQSSKGLDPGEIARHLPKEQKIDFVPADDLMPETLTQPLLSTRVSSEVSEADVRILCALFEDAKTFGALTVVPASLKRKLPSFSVLAGAKGSRDMYHLHVLEAIAPLVSQAQALTATYDCVVTNPPYMGTKFFSGTLKNFIQSQYKNAKSDLYSCFMKKSTDLAKPTGWVAMISIPNWMFLSTFEPFRRWLLAECTLWSMSHNGRGVWGSDFGSCAFVIRHISLKDYEGSYRRLFEKQGSVSSNEELMHRFFSSRTYYASNRDFKRIPGSPIAYWISQNVRQAFASDYSIGNTFTPRKGIDTGNNDLFLRFWYEIDFSEVGLGCVSETETIISGKKWFPYNKGGAFRKWYGNFLYVVNWRNGGSEIRQYTDENGNRRSNLRNQSYFFNSGITWTDVSSSSFGVRFLPVGFLCDNSGSACYGEERDAPAVLCFLISKPAFLFLRVLNPTLHFQAGNLSDLPRAVVDSSAAKKIAEHAVELSKADWESFETSWGFNWFPLLSDVLRQSTVRESFNSWEHQCIHNIETLKALEEENNRLFINAYNLEDELTADVPEDQITLAHAERGEDLKRLMSYAIGCMMGRYSLDAPGLIYAYSGNQSFDPSRYLTFPADDDGLIPVCDYDWFDDDAANRFVEFLKVAWLPDTLAENLKFVAESFGAKHGETPMETVRRYLSSQFFKDHLQTYKRRPIYWLFSSGKQRAFECLVYLHRYNESTLARMRMEYVTPLHSRMRARLEQLDGQIQSTASTASRRKLEKEQEKLRNKQAELVGFDEKLRHHADQRITLDLDDGVKVNYGKFGDLLAEVKAVTGNKE